MAMARYVLPTTALEIHRVKSALLKFGISAAGADQFMRGQPVARPEDRAAIAGMVGQILNDPSVARSFEGIKGHSFGGIMNIDTHIK
jgi:hypothetical protein